MLYNLVWPTRFRLKPQSSIVLPPGTEGLWTQWQTLLARQRQHTILHLIWFCSQERNSVYSYRMYTYQLVETSSFSFDLFLPKKKTISKVYFLQGEGFGLVLRIKGLKVQFEWWLAMLPAFPEKLKDYFLILLIMIA